MISYDVVQMNKFFRSIKNTHIFKVILNIKLIINHTTINIPIQGWNACLEIKFNNRNQVDDKIAWGIGGGFLSIHSAQ